MSNRIGAYDMTFDGVWKYLHPDPKFVGPRQPVSDYRFAAALLFMRYNDHSIRMLKNNRYSWPTIEVYWYRDFSGCVGSAKVQVTKEVVQQLISEGIIEGTARLGYTDREELQLSSRGKLLVLDEWVRGEVSITDYLKAGRTLRVA